MNFVVAHWQDLLTIATTVVSAASGIAALTPSPKDDRIIAVLRRLIDILALNIGNAAARKSAD